MTTTTEEYWSVIPLDGVEYPLQTMAFNIESWGNERQGVVPLRGEDTTIPWRPGQQSNERVADSRVIPLAMWVRGCTPDGAIPDSSSMRSEFNANWNTLKRILHNRGKLFTLRKRFYDESRTLRVADAQARFADGLNPGMMGRTGAKFTVDLLLADPYFYSTPVVLDVNSTMIDQPFTILGDAEAFKIQFAGTTDIAVVTSDFSISSTEAIHSFSFNRGGFDLNSSLLIDFQNELARCNEENFSASVNHAGSTSWFRLAPGLNQFTGSANTGSWSGTLTYQPTWN